MTDKLAIVLPSLRGGGAERILLNIAEEVVKKGYDLDIILISDKNPEYDLSGLKNANIIHTSADRAITVLPELTRYLHKYEPRSVLSTLPLPNVMCILAAKLSDTDTKTIIRVSNVHSEHEFQQFQHRIIPYLVKIFYKHADHVVGISEDVKDDLINEFDVPADIIHLINNPTAIDEITEKRQSTPIHDNIFKSDNSVILGVGRLSKQKNFETLIRSFKIVSETQKVKLIILGEGNHRRRLEDIVTELDIEEDVFLPGFVKNPYAYLYRSDVFVLSSIYEGFPNVLVEALACGCPIVASNCPGGVEEILCGGDYGELVTPKDHKMMAESILDILRGEITFDEQRLEDRAQNFSASSITREYIELMLNNHD